MTPAGIEPATFRFVEQHLNHCATALTLRQLCNDMFTTTNLSCEQHDFMSGVEYGGSGTAGEVKVLFIHQLMHQ